MCRKTDSRSERDSGMWDHSRVCGECCVSQVLYSLYVGHYNKDGISNADAQKAALLKLSRTHSMSLEEII